MEEFTLTHKDKQDARIALLKYYSSECVAHGAYLIALAVGFFGIVQVVSLLTSVDFFSVTPELVGGIVASLMLSVFIVLIIRILGRIFFWGHLTTAVLNVKPKEESQVEFESDRTTVTFIQRLHVACVDYVGGKHRWSTKINTLRISTLALICFYLFVAFTIVSLALLYLR